MATYKGVVASGHQRTSEAAANILADGGNAFDAVVAAHFTACVVEPVLASLAGGGFLQAQTAQGRNFLYDFFVQTPCTRSLSSAHFFPIQADFGDVTQEFHIGWGSSATPGTVKGLYAIHRDLCTMPMYRLAEPAIDLARYGVEIDNLQAYIIDVVKAIYSYYPDTHRRYASTRNPEQLIQAGEILYQEELADFLECLVREGEALFYQGEIAKSVDKLCKESGGYLRYKDFTNYQLYQRNPLITKFRDNTFITNPAPSTGGCLISFALKLLETIDTSSYRPGQADYLALLAQILSLTDHARLNVETQQASLHSQYGSLLDADLIADYRQQISTQPLSSRGTTHMSIIDGQGNIASLTTSNGEGCGLVIPGTGIMLNNMLGEQDLNPQGFGLWPENQRMTSMMAPSILKMANGAQVVLGSGGSNRIRSALLQVILNVVLFKMPLQQAINFPRIHMEEQLLSIEGGFDALQVESLTHNFSEHKVWDQRNLFFGGVHSIYSSEHDVRGVGDPRRSGFAINID